MFWRLPSNTASTFSGSAWRVICFLRITTKWCLLQHQPTTSHSTTSYLHPTELQRRHLPRSSDGLWLLAAAGCWFLAGAKGSHIYQCKRNITQHPLPQYRTVGDYKVNQKGKPWAWWWRGWTGKMMTLLNKQLWRLVWRWILLSCTRKLELQRSWSLKRTLKKYHVKCIHAYTIMVLYYCIIRVMHKFHRQFWFQAEVSVFFVKCTNIVLHL